MSEGQVQISNYFKCRQIRMKYLISTFKKVTLTKEFCNKLISSNTSN